MEQELLKYIKLGISISGNPVDGYEVFTVPTQHFKVASLDDLTPERFEQETQRQKDLSDFEIISAIIPVENKTIPYPIFREFH
jgi:hypothetical protein